MARISLRNVCLDYPLYGAYDFSLKRLLIGRLIREPGEMRMIRAIDDVSIEAAAGARIGLAGPNGSGKSTLLRLIACVFPATRGNVAISGNIVPRSASTPGSISISSLPTISACCCGSAGKSRRKRSSTRYGHSPSSNRACNACRCGCSPRAC